MTSTIVPPVDLAPGMPSRVVTISATDVTEGGQSLEGQTVRFALSDTLDVSSGGDVIAKTQAEVVLDSNGEGRIRLPVYTDAVKTWCGDPDWAILVTATWGSQKAIRVPAGTSSIALSSLPPVRPLRGREKQWAITGVSVSTREGAQWGASVSLDGGILDFDFTVPPGGTAWAKGALGTTDLNSVEGEGVFYQGDGGLAEATRNYPAKVAGALHQFRWGTGVVQLYYPYTANPRYGRIYMRSSSSTTWFPWIEFLSTSENDQRYDERYAPRVGQPLDETTDLDSLPGVGVYHQRDHLAATPDRNYPAPVPGTVVQYSWGTGMTQVYYPYSAVPEHGQKIYYRSRGTTTWGPWLSFLSTAEADERYTLKGEGGGSVDPEAVSSIVAADIAEPSSAPRAALDVVIGDALTDATSPLNMVTSSEVRRVVAAESGTSPSLSEGDLVVYYDRAGSHYYTNFADAELDVAPAGFSQPWQQQAWQVKAVPEATGGKALTVDSPVGNSLFALLVWDAVSADPDRADVEILYRVRSTGESRLLVQAIARGSGTEEGRTGYRAGTHSTTTVAMTRYVNGQWFSSGTVPIPEIVPDAWYMVRARLEGNARKVKVWLDTDPEPGWMIDAMDTGITDPGWVGLYAYGMPNRQEIDWIAVATGGRTATPW